MANFKIAPVNPSEEDVDQTFSSEEYVNQITDSQIEMIKNKGYFSPNMCFCNNCYHMGVFIEEIFDELYVQNSNKNPKMRDKLNSDNDLDSAPSINAFQIITLRYKKTNMNFIKILGDIFVQNNEDNCKIFVKDKEYKLCGKLDLSKIKKIGNEYEIKLKIIKDLTDLSYMFHLCSTLSPSSEISKINISKATNISYLFSECLYLSQLPDISKWNTGNIENMACIFAGCQSLLSLPDISN